MRDRKEIEKELQAVLDRVGNLPLGAVHTVAIQTAILNAILDIRDLLTHKGK